MEHITQKEWLDFLHLLHNKLRNGKGIKLTQMPALIEISNFMLFRFLDNDNLGIGLPDKLKFKHMYLKYATNKKIQEDKKTPNLVDRNCYKLWHAVYDVNNNIDNYLIGKYFVTPVLSKYLNSATSRVSAYIGSHTACETIQDIVNTIYERFKNIEFNSEFFDMFGSAYEAFKTSATGNLGKHTAQHFTNQYIKKIVIDELDPKHNEVFYEPCAGSGGFIHTADHYIVEKEGIENAKIFKNNIYANECNPEIFRPLLLNMLFHNIPVNNITEQDSLGRNNAIDMKGKVDIIATNYPFGMSNKLETGYNEEWNEYWEILRQNKTSFVKNSSAQFIVHIYHSLKENGRTGFVSDRGILNNGCDKATSWESKLRRFMFENNDVYKIVFLPQGAFTYTNFQTCIIFMKKGQKTKMCELYDSKFRTLKDKTSEIYVEDKPLKVFTFKELEDNNFSIKIEEPKEEIKEGFVNLGDIIDFDKKNKHNADIQQEQGKYVFLTSSQKIKYSDINDYDDYRIIIGTGGKGSIHYYKNFACSDHNFVLKTKTDTENLKNIYYYLWLNFSIIEDGFHGGGLKNISKSYVEKIRIPQLSQSHQDEIVEFLDKQFTNYNIELLTPYTKTIDIFKLLIHKKYTEFADVIHIIYRKIEADALDKKFESDKKAIFNMNVNLVETKEYKFKEAVNEIFSSGIRKTVQERITGNYPYYGANGIIAQIDEYKYDGEHLLCAESGTIGAVHKVNGKFFPTKDLWVIKCNETICNITYLYYHLKYLSVFTITGHGIPHFSKSNLEKLPIKIPSIADQQKIIAMIEKIESEQTSYITYANMLQEQIDNIGTIITNICNVKEQNEQDDHNENDTIDNDDEDVKPIKKIAKKTINKNDLSEPDTESIVISESSKPPKKNAKVIKTLKKKSNFDVNTNTSSRTIAKTDEDEKPIKKIAKKTINKNDLSDSDTDSIVTCESSKLPKKNVKVIKTLRGKSTMDDNAITLHKLTDSSNESEDECEKQPKKIINKKDSLLNNETVTIKKKGAIVKVVKTQKTIKK